MRRAPSPIECLFPWWCTAPICWHSPSSRNHTPNMVGFAPSFKHRILLEYSAGSRAHSFSSLARRYGIRGGHMTVSRWFGQWDGTPGSLKSRGGGGRKTTLKTKLKTKLNPKQLERYIIKPIRRANQHHVAIHYPELMDTIYKKTQVEVSLRTVQRYARGRAGVRGSRTCKRTEKECKSFMHMLFLSSTSVHDTHHASLLLMLLFVFFQCHLICVCIFPVFAVSSCG